MSNKETKVLVEGFRVFLKSKQVAEGPAHGELDFSKKAAAPAGGAINIVDFGGTVFQPTNEILKNPFFFLMLNSDGRRKYFSAIGKSGRGISNTQLVKPNSHIVSRVSSFGEPKGPEYLVGLLQKNDPKLGAFLSAVGIPADVASMTKYFRKSANTLSAMQEFIHDILAGAGVEIPLENIHVTGNKSGDAKGVFTKAIAEANSGATFHVYGNDEGDVAAMRNGLNAGGAKNVQEFLVSGTSISKV
jgi:hypothetical protein